MKLTTLAILMAAVALGAAFFLFSSGNIGLPRQVSAQREAMGTLVTITIYEESVQAAEDAIDRAFVRIVEIESVVSMNDEASEVSELNRTNYLPAASDELIEMLRLSLIVSQVSEGAFDVTIGALVDLWEVNLTADTQFEDLSSEAQGELVAEAQEHVGMERVLLGSGRKTSVSLVPGTRIELDGIVRGYAVDAAIDTLREAGIEHALVDVGGNMRAYGGKPDGSLWEIVSGNPADPDEHVASFQFNDGAVATSGNYERFFDPTVEIGQVVDPRTGYLAKAASSATVIAPTCAEAEALARAAFVLGPEAGLALIERLGSTEMLILGFEDPRDVQRSSGMAAFEKPF